MKKAFVLAILFCMFCAVAFGNGYTPVGTPPGSEKSHDEIFADIYGGTFTASGLDFSNGSISAKRVFDYDSGTEIIHIVTGDETNIDRIWTDGSANVTAEAKFAGLDQSFGWNGGGTGGTFNLLLTQDDIGEPAVPVSITGDFMWGHQANGDTWWSNDLSGLNTDGDDHLVTYLVEGLATSEKVWMLFWEDKPSSSWDYDYNDFVVEVRAIPEPATIALLGLGGLVLMRKRKA